MSKTSKLKMVMLDTICGSLLGFVELECIDSGVCRSSSECQIELSDLYVDAYQFPSLICILVKGD